MKKYLNNKKIDIKEFFVKIGIGIVSYGFAFLFTLFLIRLVMGRLRRSAPARLKTMPVRFCLKIMLSPSVFTAFAKSVVNRILLSVSTMPTGSTSPIAPVIVTIFSLSFANSTIFSPKTDE